jgi:hypothetical protein
LLDADLLAQIYKSIGDEIVYTGRGKTSPCYSQKHWSNVFPKQHHDKETNEEIPLDVLEILAKIEQEKNLS